jgi:hypothetical protein
VNPAGYVQVNIKYYLPLVNLEAKIFSLARDEKQIFSTFLQFLTLKALLGSVMNSHHLFPVVQLKNGSIFPLKIACIIKIIVKLLLGILHVSVWLAFSGF